MKKNITIEVLRDWVRDFYIDNAINFSDDGDQSDLRFEGYKLSFILDELEDMNAEEVVYEYFRLARKARKRGKKTLELI